MPGMCVGEELAAFSINRGMQHYANCGIWAFEIFSERTKTKFYGLWLRSDQTRFR